MKTIYCSKCGEKMNHYKSNKIMFYDVLTGEPYYEENYYCDNHFFRKYLIEII